MGQDLTPGLWPNPNSFVLERFLENEIDIKGRDFELIPFGTGRKMCPWLPLDYRMVHLMMVALLHSFNWKLSHGLNPADVVEIIVCLFFCLYSSA